MAWTRRRDPATDQPAVTGGAQVPQTQIPHTQASHSPTPHSPAPQPQAPQPQAAPRTPSPVPGLDHYTDLVAMARGGFSTVYRAHEPAFDRTVAIKVLASPLDTDKDRRRFERELRLTGRLTGHPHIVIPLASGITADNRAWVASPWYDEGSLADRLASGPLAVEDVLRVGVGLAGALATAHQHGIVHRDVKPANVLLDAGMFPALADFGIATTMETTSTVDALTPLHAAPEVIEQQGPVSPQSDVWSLASTLWTALAGVAPFGRPQDPPLTVMMRIVRDPLPPLTRTDAVPAELEALLRSCLEKDPARRPAGAREVGETLTAIQAQLGRGQSRLVVNPPTASHRVLAGDPPATRDVDLRDTRRDVQVPPSEATTQPTYAPTLEDRAATAAQQREQREATPQTDPQPRFREQESPGPDALEPAETRFREQAFPAPKPVGPVEPVDHRGTEPETRFREQAFPAPHPVGPVEPADPETRYREQAFPAPKPVEPVDQGHADPETRYREQPSPDPQTRLREHGHVAPLAHPETGEHENAPFPTPDHPDADPFDRATVVRPHREPEPEPEPAPTEASQQNSRPRWVVPVAVGATTLVAAAAGLIVLGSLVGDPDTPTPPTTASAPPLPTGMTLKELPDGSVQLGWDDPSKGTTSYVVGVFSGGQPLRAVVAGANGATVNGLTRGQPYCFVVKIPTGLGKPLLSGPFRCINGDSIAVSTATTT